MSAKEKLRKTRKEAFENSLSEAQLRQLYSWCASGYQAAMLNAKQEWGIKIGKSSLHRWYHKDDAFKILSFITSGAQMKTQIEEAYKKNPAPEVETLVNLCKTLIMQLSVKGAMDPMALQAANALFKSVMDFLKLEQKEKEFGLAKDKFEFDAAKAALKIWPSIKQISSDKTLSETDKVQAVRQKLFGVLPK